MDTLQKKKKKEKEVVYQILGRKLKLFDNRNYPQIILIIDGDKSKIK
jgi:hypothetical protein